MCNTYKRMLNNIFLMEMKQLLYGYTVSASSLSSSYPRKSLSLYTFQNISISNILSLVINFKLTDIQCLFKWHFLSRHLFIFFCRCCCVLLLLLPPFLSHSIIRETNNIKSNKLRHRKKKRTEEMKMTFQKIRKMSDIWLYTGIVYR